MDGYLEHIFTEIDMTQSEFIKQYCENSKITEERLNELGQFGVTCSCPPEVYEKCQGWQMTSKEELVHIVALGHL